MSATLRLLLALPAILVLGLGARLLLGGGSQSRGSELPRVEPGGGFPRRVELPGGLELRIEAPPTRILLANASAVDMVTLLVGPERLGGIPAQAMSFSRLADDPGPFADIPRFDRFEAEVVLALGPDLVICDPWAAVETVARLRDLGVAVLTLPRVSRVGDVLESLRLLGEVLGTGEAAGVVVADLEARLVALEGRAARRRGLSAVAYSNAGAGGWSTGEGTTGHEVIRLAGLENPVADSGRVGHVRIGFEELLTLDPDFVVVGDFRPGRREGATRDLLYREPALAGLRAVRQRRVILLPARLFSASSQEMVSCAERLADEVERRLAEQGGR